MLDVNKFLVTTVKFLSWSTCMHFPFRLRCVFLQHYFSIHLCHGPEIEDERTASEEDRWFGLFPAERKRKEKVKWEVVCNVCCLMYLVIYVNRVWVRDGTGRRHPRVTEHDLILWEGRMRVWVRCQYHVGCCIARALRKVHWHRP